MAPAPPPSPRSAEYAYSTSLRKGLPHAAADLSHSAQAALDRAEESLVELAVKVGLKDDSPVVANGNGQHANGNGHHANGNVDVKLVAVAADGPETPSEAFSKLSVQDTLAKHAPTSATSGLPTSVIDALLERYGHNEFEVAADEHVLLKFAKQIYENPLILLLLGSAGVSLLVGNTEDAVSIAIAVIIVLTVGFVQEQRSEKSLEALTKLVPHYCHLIRDGHNHTLLANTLVPGDLITFTVGDRIPADIRLISAIGLEIDESSLTGETEPVKKSTTAVAPHADGKVGLSERNNIGYMGTLVRNGHGSGIVVATGSKTEFGVIFSMMQDVEEKRTPLQIAMDELATQLSFLSFAIIGIIVLIGVWQKRSWLDMFTIGVSLAVAAIPEGLPIVTTVTLALGVLRMSDRKAIVKKLPSVEALGSVNVICSDKTGTLTKNEMTVTTIYTVGEIVEFADGHPPLASSTSSALRKTLEIGNLCNNAFEDDEGVVVGQATDVAILNVVAAFGEKDHRKDFERLTEIPFSSETKFMVVSGTSAGSAETIYLKGSIDAVLERCAAYHQDDASTPTLTAELKAQVARKASEIASKGLRVVAMAYGSGTATDLGQQLIFAGFQAMLDPPRRGVAEAIASLQTAGIHVVMITGDAEETATSIARDLGLRMTAGKESCLTGKAIDQMTAQQLREAVGHIAVFARVTPKHKMSIIAAFQANGDVVAMTGDGVNDAPALKMADIGISMGKGGTDVAKEAADVILVDDNFATILPAVEEGKSIFYNIQNFLVFQLSTAVAALSIITISTLFGLTNPLNAMQILFINILMDGPPAQALGVDPVDPAIMRRRPRAKNAPILTARLFARVLFSASIIITGTLWMYIAQTAEDNDLSRRDQTMTFTTFVFLDLASAIQNRGLNCPLFANRMLFLTCSISFLAQVSLIYLPFMQGVFQTEALSAIDFLTVLGWGALSMSLHETRRMYERHTMRQEEAQERVLVDEELSK